MTDTGSPLLLFFVVVLVVLGFCGGTWYYILTGDKRRRAKQKAQRERIYQSLPSPRFEEHLSGTFEYKGATIAFTYLEHDPRNHRCVYDSQGVDLFLFTVEVEVPYSFRIVVRTIFQKYLDPYIEFFLREKTYYFPNDPEIAIRKDLIYRDLKIVPDGYLAGKSDLLPLFQQLKEMRHKSCGIWQGKMVLSYRVDSLIRSDCDDIPRALDYMSQAAHLLNG